MANITRIVLTILLLSCVSSQPEKPKLISLVPPPPIENPAPEPKTVIKEHSAGEYLEFAFMQYHNRLWASSINSFELAIGTGNLNDAGRALAYWHIGDCYLKLSREDEAAEAFFFFMVVGQSILEEERRYAVTADGDFTTHFGLEKKIQDAIMFFQGLWVERQEE
jgi:hypothetical protein